MAWTWQYEDDNGNVIPVDAPTQLPRDSFPAQGDAETWIGEFWRDLLDAGVSGVTLLDGDRAVYGPMSLRSS